jgi:hypothetical protein
LDFYYTHVPHEKKIMSNYTFFGMRGALEKKVIIRF